MRRIGWFQLVMGCGIVGVWTVLLVTGQVPEVSEGRTDIWFHLAAELATGVALLIAGVLVLQRTSRASLATCVALGALGYTAINPAGYDAQSGEWGPVVLFGVVAAATLFAVVRTFRSSPPVPPADPASDVDAPRLAAPADGRGSSRPRHRR